MILYIKDEKIAKVISIVYLLMTLIIGIFIYIDARKRKVEKARLWAWSVVLGPWASLFLWISLRPKTTTNKN